MRKLIIGDIVDVSSKRRKDYLGQFKGFFDGDFGIGIKIKVLKIYNPNSWLVTYSKIITGDTLYVDEPYEETFIELNESETRRFRISILLNEVPEILKDLKKDRARDLDYLDNVNNDSAEETYGFDTLQNGISDDFFGF